MVDALSGGQRQRILIAREPICGSRYAYSDGATSALDAGLEAELIKNILNAYSHIPILVISHSKAIRALFNTKIKLKK